LIFMDCSPFRTKLYRSVHWFVISAWLLLIWPGTAKAQVSRARTNKAPRAIGVLEFLPGGKVNLIPVAIRIDGDFYDASAYKASPVPMALWSEVVYEGFRTGVSQGLFTVSGALQNQRTSEWIGEGTWQTNEQLAARAKKKTAPAEPRGLSDDEGPPVLRHSGPKQPQPQPTVPAKTPDQPSASAPAAQTPVPATSAPAPAPTPKPEPEDKAQPSLKRGKPAPKPEEPPETAVPAGSARAVPPKPQIDLVPAVSDVTPSDARSYAFEVKPDEFNQLRDKMLALAAEEIRARNRSLEGKSGPAASSGHTSRRKAADSLQPKLEDVLLRIFDLSSNNEPLLVLTAKSEMPAPLSDAGMPASVQYTLLLVEREDVNAEFHKILSNLTDSEHLAVSPRIELIDAVDADGDGRGELLFRRVSDAGSAFVIDRVIGDQLYTLFEGKLP